MRKVALLRGLYYRTFGHLVTTFVLLLIPLLVGAENSCDKAFAQPLQIVTRNAPFMLKERFADLITSVRQHREQDYVEVVNIKGLENTYFAVFSSQELMNFVLDRPTSYLTEAGKIRSHYSIVYPHNRKMETVGHDLQASLLREFYQKYQEQLPRLPVPTGRLGQKRLKMEEQFWQQFLLPHLNKEPQMILIAVSLDMSREELLGTSSHEVLHAVFYSQPHYREVIENFWSQLSEKEKQSIREQFVDYDSQNEELMMNEFQAYLLQRYPQEGLLKKSFKKYRPALLQELKDKGLLAHLL